MFYSTGHETLLDEGYDYHFNNGPDYVAQDVARRAVPAQFQTYPRNMVEGRGTLVRGGYGFLPGAYFQEFQPPQVFQNFIPIGADLLGGGIDYNGLVQQPLVSGD